MNIAKSFVGYLESLSFGVSGQNLFIGTVPQNAPDSAMWVVTSGGSAIIKARTGEKVKNYIVNVYYRSKDQELVYDTLQELEEAINSDNCAVLADYETVEMEATSFPADQDLDVEDRTVGLLQITITTYSDDSSGVS
jgi:hypothetical protein